MLKFQNNLHVSMSCSCLIFMPEVSGMITALALVDTGDGILFLFSKPFIASARSTCCMVNTICSSVKGVIAFEKSF